MMFFGVSATLEAEIFKIEPRIRFLCTKLEYSGD